MKIWIMNHYATTMFFDKAGRHYWFANELRKRGYEPTVFTANTFLNSMDVISTGKKKYTCKKSNRIPFVFVKTITSQGNGIKRVLNWLLFYLNLFPSAKAYAKSKGKPDLIIASSVHPLTMVAGIQIAKKYKIP